MAVESSRIMGGILIRKETGLALPLPLRYLVRYLSNDRLNKKIRSEKQIAKGINLV